MAENSIFITKGAEDIVDLNSLTGGGIVSVSFDAAAKTPNMYVAVFRFGKLEKTIATEVVELKRTYSTNSLDAGSINRLFLKMKILKDDIDFFTENCLSVLMLVSLTRINEKTAKMQPIKNKTPTGWSISTESNTLEVVLTD